MAIIDKGPYRIKTWGKEMDGEFVVDGYSYKGRKPFLKVLEGFKSMMVKGFKGDINGIKMEVLDSRIVGAELAIDIACTKNKNRGIAVMKIYGPSTKKQNVVMATKSKGSDTKYMVMLAKEVIEPLIDKFLNNDEEEDNNKGNEKADEIKCSLCDKTFKTKTALKGHLTRMHKQTDDKTQDDIRSVKSYQHKCDKCDFTTNANRRYLALQLVQKHKEDECINRTIKIRNKCDLCEFKANNPFLMKRHIRDKHDIKTQSTSPPCKKQKRQEKDVSVEPMDVDNNQEDIEDLDKTEKELLKKRSDYMDAKIKEKERLSDERETLFRNKKIAEENRKKELEAKMLEESKMLNKKRKQSLKDQRKIVNKKIKQKVSDTKDNHILVNNPKIKEIPQNCKHLVEVNDVLYVVPGDGCCGPNCAAAFLFHEEAFGPQLRIKMNQHMVLYWKRRYENLTQCSPESPFERKIGKETVKFTDPEALLEFLQTDAAAYIWTDSEDLAVLSDMYQIMIKIITSKGKDDENPIVNWIYPDPDMKDVAELKNVDLEVMSLYHENDCHFNLIIDKNSELALKGSISSRLDAGSTSKNEEMIKNDKHEKKSNEKDDKDNEIIKLKKELKACKENISTMIKKYNECEEELKSKTEEAEISKIEIKDLRMIIRLKDELDEKKRNHVEHSRKQTQENSTEYAFKTTSKDIRLKSITCHECGFKASSKIELEKHMKVNHVEEHTDEEFNCKKCDFQATTEYQLKKHFSLKHTLQGVKEDEEIRCKNCGEQVIGKRNLMVHRKQQHRNTVATCKNYLEGKCPRSPENCWWNHQNVPEKKDDTVCCYTCDETFKSKNEMMEHRKSMHEKLVKTCYNFLQNNCKRQNILCWFKHKSEEKDNDILENMNESKDNLDEAEESSSVFHRVLGNLKPPIVKEPLSQKME